MKSDNKTFNDIEIYSIEHLEIPKGITITVKANNKSLPKIYFEDTETGSFKKITYKQLHKGGLWLIEQKGEDRPFVTCNPAYIRAYEHLFITCQFIKLVS